MSCEILILILDHREEFLAMIETLLFFFLEHWLKEEQGKGKMVKVLVLKTWANSKILFNS